MSTGPKSPPGKVSSRSNSLKHGLSGEGVVVDPEHQAEAMNRKIRWTEEIRPTTLTGMFALDRAVAMSLRMEACENALDALFVEQSTKARLDWEHTRKVEALALAGRLAKDPSAVAGQLQVTRQGVELMLEHWGHLAKSLDLGAWDESDRSSALDLLGVEATFRKPGQTVLDAPDGADAVGHVREVIGRETARLRDRLGAILEETDTLARRQAESSLDVLRSKPAALVLRYEREATRRFLAALKTAKAGPRDETPTTFDPGPYHGPEPDDEPETVIPIAGPAPEPEAEPGPTSGLGEDYWRKLEAMMIGSGLIAPDSAEPPTESEPEPEPAVAPEPSPSRKPMYWSATLTGLAARHEGPLNRRGRRAEAARLRRLG